MKSTTRQLSSPETAERVLAFLAAGADEDGLVQIALRDIGEHLGLGRNTVHTATSRLLADGRVEIARPGTGDGYPTRYRILRGPHVRRS